MKLDPRSPMLDGIEVQHVTSYLGSTGWKRRDDFPRPEVHVFDGPLDDEGEPIQAVIPSSSDMRDFRVRLADLVEALSAIEERTTMEIALDMLNPNMDRVRARVLSDMSASGSIPLPFASVLLKGLHDLVTAAACAEENPRPFYAKATNLGIEHAKAWRFGQTQLGSFVATIECPVLPPLGRAASPRSAPLSRRVTERIMRGLGDLDRAVLDGRPDALREAYRSGLNATCAMRSCLSGDPASSSGWSSRFNGANGSPRVPGFLSAFVWRGPASISWTLPLAPSGRLAKRASALSRVKSSSCIARRARSALRSSASSMMGDASMRSCTSTPKNTKLPVMRIATAGRSPCRVDSSV